MEYQVVMLTAAEHDSVKYIGQLLDMVTEIIIL